MPRIMLIHAVAEAVVPIRQAFAADWPAAETHDLMDTSLSSDLAADGGKLGARMVDRFKTLGRYAAAAGPDGRASDAILFTCSAFGPAIEAVRGQLAIPGFQANEAAVGRALHLRTPLTGARSLSPSP